MSENQPCENTDKEVWREKPGDYYSDSIFVTRGGEIGINCGGYIYVRPVREWFKAESRAEKAEKELAEIGDRFNLKHKNGETCKFEGVFIHAQLHILDETNKLCVENFAKRLQAELRLEAAETKIKELEQKLKEANLI